MWKYIFISLFVFISTSYGQDLGNPDDFAVIVRPCPSFDLNCIRIFFSENSYCKVMYGPVPDPYFRPKDKFYFPRINVTVTTFDEVITGLNGRVEDFYINNTTDKVVLVIEFRNISLASNSTYLRYHRRAKEPITTRTFVRLFLQTTSMTAIFPKRFDLRLDTAEITAFSFDTFPPAFLGPKGGISNDPTIPIAFTEMFTNLAVNNQEYFLTESSFYVSTYIQYNICDFSLKVL